MDIKRAYESLPDNKWFTVKDIGLCIGMSLNVASYYAEKMFRNGSLEKKSGGGRSRIYRKNLGYVYKQHKRGPSFKDAYGMLPTVFHLDDVKNICEYRNLSNACHAVNRMLESGLIAFTGKVSLGSGKRVKTYKKIEHGKTPSDVPVPTPAQPSVQTSSKSSLLTRIMEEFAELPNHQKVEFVKQLIPTIDSMGLRQAFAAINPEVADKFAKIEQGHWLFHPLVGYVEIVEVGEEWLRFNAFGRHWEVNKNGFAPGNENAIPVLYFSMEDYIENMRQMKCD